MSGGKLEEVTPPKLTFNLPADSMLLNVAHELHKDDTQDQSSRTSDEDDLPLAQLFQRKKQLNIEHLDLTVFLLPSNDSATNGIHTGNGSVEVDDCTDDESDVPPSLLVECCLSNCARDDKVKEQMDRDSSNKGRYTCKECGKSYSHRDSFRNHRRTHTGQRFSCQQCDKSFAYNSSLRNHILTSHNNEKRHACRFCGKKFSLPRFVILHERVHTGERPFECLHCKKRFSSQTGLGMHARVHTGEKSYVCPYCGRRFSQLGTLKMHVHLHDGRKPLRCRFCEKRFIQPSALKSHERTHTGERPYACPHCEKGFITGTRLKNHLWVHTGEKPFVCDLCHKRLATRGSLRVHRRTQHMANDSPLPQQSVEAGLRKKEQIPPSKPKRRKPVKRRKKRRKGKKKGK